MDLEVIKLFWKVYAFCEKGHAITNFPFAPIKAGIVRHVKLQNKAWTLVDQSHDQKPRFFVVHNRLKNMELRGQLGPHNRQICPSIQFKSYTQKMYSHPHSGP